MIARSAAKKPIVLICSTPVSGHIIPMMAIAKHLVDTGYDVCFVSGSGYRREVEALGASYVSVKGYGDFCDLTSWDLDQECEFPAIAYILLLALLSSPPTHRARREKAPRRSGMLHP